MRRLCLLVLACAAGCSRDLDVPVPAADTVDGRAVAEDPGTSETKPATGARVEFVGTGIAVLADTEGLFHFDKPPPAPRSLLISWSSTNGATADRQRLLKSTGLDLHGAVQLGEVLVAANGTLRGRALLADKPADSPDQIGTVIFVPNTPYATITGEGGAFLLSHLPPGTVSLGVSHTGYPIGSISGIDLSAGSDLNLQALSLVPATAAMPTTGSLKGQAQKPDGTPSSGAMVSAAPSQGGTASTAITGADGSFSFASLPVGPYAVTVTDTAAQVHALVGGVLVSGASGGADLGTVSLTTVPLAAPPPSGTPQPPVALPGADHIVRPGTPVLLDGSASEGDQLVFHWSSDAPVTFSINDSAIANRTTFVAPDTATTLHLTLVVEDVLGQKSAAAVARVFIDHPPVARLAAPTQSRSAVPILLDASTSTDPDVSDVLTYTFINTTSPTGATVTLAAGVLAAQALATVSAEGSYGFRVIVSDGHLSTASDEAIVLVANINHAPIARIASVLPVEPGVDVVLDGTGSSDPDPGDTLTYAWSPLSGAPALISGATSSLAHMITPASVGAFQYQLIVTDSHGLASDPADVSVQVSDHSPIAVLLGPVQSRSGIPFLLDASGTTDPDAADLLTYTFIASTVPGGATATFTAGPLLSQVYATASAEGSFGFRVVVSDGHLSATSAEATVLIANVNHAPTARIASLGLVDPGTDVLLDGTGSSDPDPGDTLTYAWTALSGAPALASGATASIAHVTAPPTAGSYSYQLIVKDSHAVASPAASVTVVVNAPPPPPIPIVIATSPGDGSTNVPVGTQMEFDYSSALDSSSVGVVAMSVTSGGNAIPGRTSYAELGSGAALRHAVVFVADLPLPINSVITVSVVPLSDLLGRVTAAYSFSFTTSSPTWVDISPPNPHRTGRWSGAPDGGVDFSDIPFAPALSTNASGATYVADFETGGNPYGGYLRHFDDGTQVGSDGGVIPQGWSLVPAADTEMQSLNNCCTSVSLPNPVQAINAPFRRTYLSSDGTTLPAIGYDVDDLSLYIGASSQQSDQRLNVVRDGLTFANDGTTSWTAFRGCDSVSSSAQTELWILPTTATSTVPSSIGLAVVATGNLNSCTNLQPNAFDLWMGAPAIAGGASKLYAAVSLKTAAAAPYGLLVYSRPAGVNALFGAPIVDANHPGDATHPAGALNVAATTQNSTAVMSPSPTGPLLVFLEGTGPTTSLRATRFDEASQTFVDPLTNSATSATGAVIGTSAIAPLQLDGASFNTAYAPAALAIGRGAYVAWNALSGTSGVTGHRVFVAHADSVQQKWILDADHKNTDGALNVHSGCDASMPSVALIQGLPAVAWSESCAVPGQTWTDNFLIVHRLQ